MKKLSLIIATVLFSFGVANVVNAQDDNSAEHTISIQIDEVALVDIEGETGTSISLDPVAPTEAGLGVVFTNATNNDLWLNYSSIVAADKTRSISAAISGGLPGGATISVAAAAPTSDGKGAKGSANTTPQTLTSGGVTVISGIGSCYTGNSFAKGSNISYKLNMDETSYGSLYADEDGYEVTITYTISDDE
jgi:hypothetical protein